MSDKKALGKAHSFWLSRQYNGSYMFTALRPRRVRVLGTDHEDLYERPGEPIGLRNLCAAGVRTVFRVDLDPLESRCVRVAAGCA